MTRALICGRVGPIYAGANCTRDGEQQLFLLSTLSANKFTPYHLLLWQFGESTVDEGASYLDKNLNLKGRKSKQEAASNDQPRPPRGLP